MILEILDHELAISTKVLREAKIPVILLKGMDLGRRYYSERLFRPMTNVDLLVPSDKYKDALLALGRVGYRAEGEASADQIRIELARRSGGPAVAVHRALLAEDDGELTEDLWRRSKENKVSEFPGLRTLSTEDAISYLIARVRFNIARSRSFG